MMCMGRFGWVEFHSINQSNRNLVGAYQTFKCMDKMKHALSRKHMPKAHILAWNLWWKYISKTNTYCKMRMLWNISKYNLQVKMIGSPPKSWIWWCYRHRSQFFLHVPFTEPQCWRPGNDNGITWVPLHQQAIQKSMSRFVHLFGR